MTLSSSLFYQYIQDLKNIETGNEQAVQQLEREY